MPSLTEFLVKISADPKQLARFKKNPAAAMKRAKLTAEEKEAVLSGKAEKLRTALNFASWGPGKVK